MTTDAIKLRDIVSKVTVTDDAKPSLVQDILSWLSKTEPEILYVKRKK